MAAGDGSGPGVISPEQNMLLAAWPGATPSDLWLMRFEQGDTVQLPGTAVEAALFPVTAVLALAVEADGVTDPVEVHHLGREGAVGTSVLVGDRLIEPRITCAVAGAAWVLPADELIAAAAADDAVTQLVQRYLHALTGHLARRVACTSAHTLEHRFAAALLTTTWQTGGGDTVALTQADLARMLLVRRATVSTAATRLADAGVIRYRYGTITIADPVALRATACACHRTNHEAYLAVGAG